MSRTGFFHHTVIKMDIFPFKQSVFSLNWATLGSLPEQHRHTATLNYAASLYWKTRRRWSCFGSSHFGRVRFIAVAQLFSRRSTATLHTDLVVIFRMFLFCDAERTDGRWKAGKTRTHTQSTSQKANVRCMLACSVYAFCLCNVPCDCVWCIL